MSRRWSIAGLPGSQFEAAFVSLAHSPDDVARTLEASREAVEATVA
jgi:glutamate-1-semialdehyde aminotransferase